MNCAKVMDFVKVHTSLEMILESGGQTDICECVEWDYWDARFVCNGCI